MHSTRTAFIRPSARLQLLVAVPMIALFAAGCVDTPADPLPDPGPIVIATTFSETGARAVSARQMVAGYRMAVAMLNEAGGIGGREVRLVAADDESSPTVAARRYFEFVASDSISALLSPYSSPITEAAMAVTEAAGWPLVASLASAPSLWAGRERQWTVQMLGPATLQHKGAVEIAAQNGIRTVGIVHENTTYASAVAQGVRTHAQANGLEVVFDRSYPLGGADHETLMSGARDAGAEMLAGGLYFPDAVAFARAVKATGYTPRLIAMRVGAEDPLFLEELGDLARCIVGSSPWIPRMRTTGFIADGPAFVQRYEAEHEAPPNYAVAAGFGAVELVAEAISVAMTAEGEVDRAAMRDHLFAFAGGTVLGPYEVNPLGHEEAGAQLALGGVQLQWQDDGSGGLVQRIIHPPEAAEAEPCLLPASKPIVLATTFSETGARAVPGTQMVTGYRMAVEMLNEAGGIGGREVRLVALDDESSPAVAARRYFEFVTSDSISAILSPYSSPITEAVMTVTEAAGWPLVASLASAPDLWEGRNREWSVQVLSPAPLQHKGAIEIAADNGIRRVALVYENTSFTSAMARGVRTYVRENGLELVLDQSYPFEGADHEALMSAAKDAGSDMLVGATYFPDAVAFARAVEATAYTPRLIALKAGAEDPLFLEEVGDLARCVVGSAPWVPRIRTTGFISDGPTVARRYEAEHDAAPYYGVVAGFGAVELVAEAISVAMTADGDIDRTAMRDHLFAFSDGTVLGPFAVRPLGHAEAGAQTALGGVQLQWQDDGSGGLVQRIIHPPESAEAEPCLLGASNAG